MIKSVPGTVSLQDQNSHVKEVSGDDSPLAIRDLTQGQWVCRIKVHTSVSHRFVSTPASIFSSPERLEKVPMKISPASILHSIGFTVIWLTRIKIALKDQR